MKNLIMHNKVSCNPKTIREVTRAINQGRLNIEKDIKDFEREIEKYLFVEKGSCIAVSSGSIALLLSIYSLDKKYDEFIIPSYTCKSISSSLKFLNKKNIKYIDSSNNNFPSFSINNLKRNQFAVIPHMLGFVNKIDAEFRDNIIEDISQCIDGKVNKKRVGSQSRYGIISLYATKQLTGMGSGAILYCRNKIDRDFIRDLIDLNTPFKKGISLNMRMMGINCIYAKSELNFLKEKNKKRAWIRKKYIQYGLTILRQSENNVKQGNYRAIIKSKNPKKLISSLKNNNIKAIKPYLFDELPSIAKEHKNTSEIVNSLVSLPCHPSLTKEDLKRISDIVNKIEIL